MILAVSCQAKAIGWIKKLIVLMIINIGIRGADVPCGKKWVKHAFVLLQKPVMTVPTHKGIALPKFIDS